LVSQLTARDLGPRRGLSVIPAFTAGVRVDEQGRPLSESGSPAYGNLRACGSVVAACGHDGGAGLCLALAARATASVPA
jgi:anaerobic glycerol-3-phosphate dehydrogenase